MAGTEIVGGAKGGLWNFNTVSLDTSTAPVKGRFRTNSGTYRNATQIAIHGTTIQDINRADVLRTLLADDIIQFQDSLVSAAWCRYVLQSPPIDNGTWFQLNVALEADGNVKSGDNQEIIVLFTANSIGAGAVRMRSYLAGLTLSMTGSSQIFGIAAGAASDSTNALMMTLPAAYTKTTSAWVVGSGNGSLDTGSITASTWYHVHLIRRSDTGVVDVLISLSDTAPTLPANYTQFRRIGSMLTNASSQWVKFVQTGDEFLWDAPTLDINGVAVGVPSQTFTMPVAPNSEAIMNLYMVSNTVNTLALAHSLVAAAASVVNAPLANFQFVTSIANSASQATVRIRMNASRQFRVVSNATTATCTITGTAIGWIDRRGRDS